MVKRKEGYVMAYVMVVIVVVCAISVAVCSVALINLRSQQAAVDYAEQKYLAVGELEKFIGELEWRIWEAKTDGYFADISELSDEQKAQITELAKEKTVALLKDECEDAVESAAGGDAVDDPVSYSNILWTSESVTENDVTIECPQYFDATIQVSRDGFEITAGIRIYLSYTISDVTYTTNTEGDQTGYKCSYTINDVNVEYQSYTIEQSGGGG